MPRNIRLTPTLEKELLDYCDRADRRAPDVIRAALRLLLQDGHEEAERRIASGVWDKTSYTPAEEAAQRQEAREVLADVDRRLEQKKGRKKKSA